MTKPPNFIVGVNRKSNTEIEESNKNWKHNNLGGKTPNLEKNSHLSQSPIREYQKTFK